jgi:hypothetical protein
LGLVVTKGQVSGTARGSWLYVRTSCGVGTQQGPAETVPITGTMSSSQFQLIIALDFPGLQLPVTVPLTSPKTAHAQNTDQLPAQTRTNTIDLTCANC